MSLAKSRSIPTRNGVQHAFNMSAVPRCIFVAHKCDEIPNVGRHKYGWMRSYDIPRNLLVICFALEHDKKVHRFDWRWASPGPFHNIPQGASCTSHSLIGKCSSTRRDFPDGLPDSKNCSSVRTVVVKRSLLCYFTPHCIFYNPCLVSFHVYPRIERRKVPKVPRATSPSSLPCCPTSKAK